MRNVVGMVPVVRRAHAHDPKLCTQSRSGSSNVKDTNVAHTILTDTGCLLLISLSETLSCNACSAAECGSSAGGHVASAMQYFFTRYA